MTVELDTDITMGLLESRRRHASAASARSVLLTILGEYLHPTGAPVWTSAFVEAMAALGIEEKAARQALTRTASHGLISSSRQGRRVLWTLTDHGREVLEEGTTRIYSFMRVRRPWDGRWLVLNVAIPETRRQLRQRLGTRLTWLGLGAPTPGLWITPNTDTEADIATILEELDLTGNAFAWIGPTAAAIDVEPRLISMAWDLTAVAKQYQDFINTFVERAPASEVDVFRNQVELIHAWRRFPFIDPDLPAELLPSDWPGIQAANTFHERHSRWHRTAQSAWTRFASD